LRLFILRHNNKKLSCRKETVRLQRGSVLDKCNQEMIFYRHYRHYISSFKHCDVIDLQRYRSKTHVFVQQSLEPQLSRRRCASFL